MRRRGLLPPRSSLAGIASAIVLVAGACTTAVIEPERTAEQEAGKTPAPPPVSEAVERGPSSAAAGLKGRQVPTSIDATGASNAQPALQAFIDGVPDGSTVVFKAGGTYRLDKALRVSGKRNLTLEGNGARLDLPATHQDFNSIGLIVQGGSRGTTIRNFTMVGNNSQAGTSDACCTRENNHAVAVLSSFDTIVERMDIRRVWGDCLYMNYQTFGGAWNDGVTFRDSTCRLTGRHGVTIEGARNVRIVRNDFDQIGYMVVDIEPYRSDQGAEGVVIQNNSVGSYGLTGSWEPWFFAASGHEGSVVRDVTIEANTVTGNRAGYDGRMLGLNITVNGTNKVREDFVVKNNVAKSTTKGPIMRFTDNRRVTVTGNTQPLSSGELATFPGTSGVTYDPSQAKSGEES